MGVKSKIETVNSLIAWPSSNKTWLADQPVGRFEIGFTPAHGSWLGSHRGLLLQARTLVLRQASASHPNRNSRIASWLPWMNSIAIAYLVL